MAYTQAHHLSPISCRDTLAYHVTIVGQSVLVKETMFVIEAPGGGEDTLSIIYSKKFGFIRSCRSEKRSV